MRVLIVDDHLLFAEAIQMALKDKGLDQVAIVADGSQALVAMREQDSADVVLMDIGLPDQSGLALGKRLIEEFPDVKVLALTAASDPKLLREAMRAGFSGYLTKDTEVSRLVRAMKMAAVGEIVIPRKLVRGVEASGQVDPSVALLAGQLTDREREVLVLLAQGSPSDEIAKRMQISRSTVRTHVQNILAKLGVHSRLEAAAFAVRHEIVNPRQVSA